MALARGEGLGRVLIEQEHGTGGRTKIGQGGGHTPRKVDEPPALEIGASANAEIIEIGEGTGPVDQQRFHECGAVGPAKALLEEFLHQSERAGHICRRHAGARFEAVERTKALIQIAEHLEEITDIIGRVVIGSLVPFGRTRGDDKRAGCDDVGFESAGSAFDADANIAAAGKSGHLVGGIGHRQPGLIGLAGDGVIGRASPNLVGDAAQLFDGAYGDDILGCGRRLDAIRAAALAVVIAVAVVARGEHVEHRLRTRYGGQSVADGGVVTGGCEVVIARAIGPAIVGDKGIRARSSLLQIRVGPGGQDREEHCTRCLASELKIHGWEEGALGAAYRGGPEAAASDDGSHVRAVAVRVHAAEGEIEKDTAEQVRMVGIHASVVDVDENVGAGQAKIVIWCDCVGGNTDGGAAEVVGGNTHAGQFDLLHTGQTGECREMARRGTNFKHRAEGGTILAHTSRPSWLRVSSVVSRAPGKQKEG